MSKLYKKLILIIGIILSLFLLSYICDSLNKKAKLNTVEGFNIFQYYNSNKRKFNRMKNNIWNEGKNKLRKMFYKK